MSRREFVTWWLGVAVVGIAVAIGGGINDKRESAGGIPPADGEEPPLCR